MARDNYPEGFNETLLENPMADLREIVEESADITYELHVYVDGELIAYKKTSNAEGITDSLRAAESLVGKKIDELTDLRVEHEREGINGR